MSGCTEEIVFYRWHEGQSWPWWIIPLCSHACIPGCCSKMQGDITNKLLPYIFCMVNLCCIQKLMNMFILLVISLVFRSLGSLLCTLSSVLLVETRQRHLVLVLNLRLELLHVLGWRLDALVSLWRPCVFCVITLHIICFLLRFPSCFSECYLWLLDWMTNNQSSMQSFFCSFSTYLYLRALSDSCTILGFSWYSLWLQSSGVLVYIILAH
jgi:hypothetical protein